MAAKKARGWRSGRREGRSRMVQMTRHLVVSEGKETEPRYFEGVRAALGAANGRKVAIVVKGTGKHTLDLLDFAVEHCRYAPETFDHVWLVFDKDDFPAVDFDAMERKCAELSDGSRTFHALWSNPCFELWLFLHLRYTTARPVGRRVPARPRSGDVEGPGRRVPQEPRRVVRHGEQSTGRGGASRATSGSAPWGVGQRQAICAEPRDQGRRDIRRDRAVFGWVAEPDAWFSPGII